MKVNKIIGNEATFAVAISIESFRPHLWGRTAIILEGETIGNLNESNYLSAFMRSLWRIIFDNQCLWDDELEGLSFKEIFYRIHPFFDCPEDFYDISDEEMEELTKYDKYLMDWGENFNDSMVSVVVNSDKCHFLILPSFTQAKMENADSYYNHIKCTVVPLDEVRKVYHDLCELIPGGYWPYDKQKL